MSYHSLAEMDRRDPIFGLTRERMRDEGLLGGGAEKTSDYTEEKLVIPDVSGEVVDPAEVERALSVSVSKDIEKHDVSFLLQPQNAFDLALDAYNTYARDTALDMPHCAATYFHHLSEQLPPEVDRERFYKEIEQFLSELDGKYHDYIAAIAETDLQSPLVSA